MAEKEGSSIPTDHILGTDWHSLSVWNSPPMEQLKELIRSQAIRTIFMYDPDRGPSKPAHRLLFRAMCEEYGVKVICCHGQVPEGEMGEVMEFLSAWSKEKQVLRAQQGARDGIRDRARLKRLPPSTNPPYGYLWDGAHFRPDPVAAPVVRKIWDMALDGTPFLRIVNYLTENKIPSPSGLGRWHTSTLGRILSNPVYKGEYVALRTERAEPKNRVGPTYGKSSSISRINGEPIPLPDLVSEAIFTQEEFSRVENRLAQNKANGGRVVQKYMLRGRIRCELCGRKWRGKVVKSGKYRYHRYLCKGCEDPMATQKCSAKSLRGPDLEDRIWEKTLEFLSNPMLFIGSLQQQHTNEDVRERVEHSISRLNRRLSKLETAEAKAYSGYVREMVSQAAYE